MTNIQYPIAGCRSPIGHWILVIGCSLFSARAANANGIGGSVKASAKVLVLLVALLVASPLGAQERTPAEAERLYQQVGSELFCICGCRENLLTCSHNVCSAKDEERKFLRKLAADSKLDDAAIKQEMVKRFGPGVLQVPGKSSLYPLLALAGAALVAAFGAGFWFVTRRGDRPPQAPREIDPELEARIADELKELD